MKRNLRKCNNKGNNWPTQKTGKKPQKLEEDSLVGAIQSITDTNMVEGGNKSSGTRCPQREGNQSSGTGCPQGEVRENLIFIIDGVPGTVLGLSHAFFLNADNNLMQ